MPSPHLFLADHSGDRLDALSHSRCLKAMLADTQQSLNNSLPNPGNTGVLIRATGTKNLRAQPPALRLTGGGFLVRIQAEEPFFQQLKGDEAFAGSSRCPFSSPFHAGFSSASENNRMLAYQAYSSS
jgi:hypothetical protein